MLRNATISATTCRTFSSLQAAVLNTVDSVGVDAIRMLLATRSFSTSDVCRNANNSSRLQGRSSWVPPQDRRRGVHYTPTARRPQVNGKPIAFHVNELQALANVSSSLPQSKKKYQSDLIVVLDMDECLIHSQFLSSPAAARVFAHQLLQQRRQQSSSTKSAVCESFRVTLPDGDLVHVNVRPGLFDFIEKVTAKFETHIFTAALPIYANPVLDRLDPDRTRFAGRWYRDSCTYDPPPNGSGAFVKNLTRLPFNRQQLGRTVLVDNNPLSFLANPDNGILVDNFYNDASDTSLAAVWDLLEELEQHGDVRPVLKQKFALEASLKKVARSELNQVAA